MKLEQYHLVIKKFFDMLLSEEYTDECMNMCDEEHLFIKKENTYVSSKQLNFKYNGYLRKETYYLAIFYRSDLDKYAICVGNKIKPKNMHKTFDEVIEFIEGILTPKIYFDEHVVDITTFRKGEILTKSAI